MYAEILPSMLSIYKVHKVLMLVINPVSTRHNLTEYKLCILRM